jgi:hypothetical protein
MKIDWESPAQTEHKIKKPLPPDVFMRLKYVRDNLSYGQVYAYYGYEWRSNSTHQLSCVFHAKHRDSKGRPYEENPSARYYEHDRQIYCFGCAEGGDVIWFVQKREQLQNTVAALDFIERTFGIGLNTQNLAKRIEAFNSATTEVDKRKIITTMYQDHINDLVHKLKRAAPVAVPHLEDVQLAANKARQALEAQQMDYAQYVKAVRAWRDQTIQTIKHVIQDIQTGVLK